MKVYIVLEGYHNGYAKSETESKDSVIGAFATRELAEKEIRLRMKETADEITKGDENNCSAISEECPWNGTEAMIEDEYCDRWNWRIVEENVVDDEDEEKCAYRVGDAVKWRDPETDDETDGWKVIEVNGETITIMTEDGSEAEVFENELTPA